MAGRGKSGGKYGADEGYRNVARGSDSGFRGGSWVWNTLRSVQAENAELRKQSERQEIVEEATSAVAAAFGLKRSSSSAGKSQSSKSDKSEQFTFLRRFGRALSRRRSGSTDSYDSGGEEKKKKKHSKKRRHSSSSSSGSYSEDNRTKNKHRGESKTKSRRSNQNRRGRRGDDGAGEPQGRFTPLKHSTEVVTDDKVKEELQKAFASKITVEDVRDAGVEWEMLFVGPKLTHEDIDLVLMANVLNKQGSKMVKIQRLINHIRGVAK